jgi:hypothetical protein
MGLRAFMDLLFRRGISNFALGGFLITPIVAGLLMIGVGCQSTPDAATTLELWNVHQAENTAVIVALRRQLHAEQDKWGSVRRSSDDQSLSAISRVDAILKSSAQSLVDIENDVRISDQNIKEAVMRDLTGAQRLVTVSSERVRENLNVVRHELEDATRQLSKLTKQ